MTTSKAIGGDSDHLADPALLKKIDQLRERNIGKHIALPQVRFQYV
jgi:hypothetical protein